MTDAVLRSDGSRVIADGPTSELISLSPGGTIANRIGGRGDRTVVGSNDSLNLSVFRASSPTPRLRAHRPPQAVSEDAREEWRRRLPRMQGETPSRIPIRETFPAFGALGVDALGRIWVGDYGKPGDGHRVWTVFGPSGTPLGRVELPLYDHDSGIFRTMTLATMSEFLDVTSDRVAVLRKNGYDEEFVEVLEILGPGLPEPIHFLHRLPDATIPAPRPPRRPSSLNSLPSRTPSAAPPPEGVSRSSPTSFGSCSFRRPRSRGGRSGRG